MKSEYDTRLNGLWDAMCIVLKLHIGSTFSTPKTAKRKLREILERTKHDDSFIEGINDDIATGFAVAVDIIKDAISDKQFRLQEREEEAAKKPKTNADRIRCMTDEELAKWLLTPADLCGQCDTHDFCTGYPHDKDARCIAAVIKYLKQPVKEEV